MIYNNSVLDGFPIVLGSTPVQFGMGLTMLLSVVIPHHTETGEDCTDAVEIYRLLLFVHCFVVGVKIFGEFIGFYFPMVYKSLVVIALFIQLLVINVVLGNWIFNESEDKQNSDLNDLHDPLRGPGWET